MEHYTYIYYINGVPEYVGKGVNTRAFDHLRERSKSLWCRHLQKAFRENRKIEIKLATWSSTDGEAKAEEIRLIALFGRRDLGTGTLYNLTPGGDGIGPGRPLSDAHKAAMSATTRGRKKSDEWKAKVSASLMGHVQSDEAKAKMSASKKGKPWSDARRNALKKREQQATVNSSLTNQEHP